jgi:hypothetical protein
MKFTLPSTIALVSIVAATGIARPIRASSPAAADAAPVISSLSRPSSLAAGASAVFVINGSNFIVGGQLPRVSLVVNGTQIPLQVNSANSTTIQLTVLADTLTLAGTHALRVANDDGADTEPFTITPAALDNLIVRADINGPNPFTPTLQVNTTIVLFAIGRDRFNNRVPDVQVNWGAFSGGSLVTTTPFTATYKAGTTAGLFITERAVFTSTFEAAARIQITPGPFASLLVLPALGTVTSGGQITFTATGIDAFGNEETVRNVAWSSNRAAGIIGSASGRFTATGPAALYGDAVTATLGALSATAAVNIIGAPPQEITIRPSAVGEPGMAMGTTRLFTATVIDGAGDPTNGPVNWSSTIGAIVSSGPLTAVLRAGTTAGTGVIRAEAGGIDATASVLVPPALTPLFTAQPPILITNGRATTTLVLTTTSAAGPLGAGIPVTFSYAAANDRCIAQPATGVTASDGTFTTVLRCTHANLNTADEQIRATLALGVQPAVSGDISITGRFQPLRMLLPIARRDEIRATGNNTTCAAYPLVYGEEIVQPADNEFNIYKITATGPNALLTLQNYRANGGVVYVYAVVQLSPCPTAARLLTPPLLQQQIAAGAGSQTIQIRGMTAGTQYVIALQSNAPLSSERYRLRITPQ